MTILQLLQLSKLACVASRPITGIAISGETIGIIDDEIQLMATLTPPNNTTETGILWSSSDNTIADVDANGLVSLKTVGIVTPIKATSSVNAGIYDELVINISAEAIPISFITVSGNYSY